MGHTCILPRITRDVLLNLAGAALVYAPQASYSATLKPSMSVVNTTYKIRRARRLWLFIRTWLFNFLLKYWCLEAKDREVLVSSFFFFPMRGLVSVAKAWAPRILRNTWLWPQPHVTQTGRQDLSKLTS